MGSSKLEVPPEYILGPVEYKGIDIWKAESYKNTPKHPTFNNGIDVLSIRVRQTNFKPIETEADRADYFRSYEDPHWVSPPENRWIHVDLDARHYPISPREKAGWWNGKDTSAYGGPFVKAKNVWGLVHYVSVQGPSASWNRGDQVEVFYDEAGDSAFMFCRNTLKKVPPHNLMSNCQIEFDVPKLMAHASILNIRDEADLAKWREMREGVLRVVDSFIVP